METDKGFIDTFYSARALHSTGQEPPRFPADISVPTRKRKEVSSYLRLTFMDDRDDTYGWMVSLSCSARMIIFLGTPRAGACREDVRTEPIATATSALAESLQPNMLILQLGRAYQRELAR